MGLDIVYINLSSMIGKIHRMASSMKHYILRVCKMMLCVIKEKFTLYFLTVETFNSDPSLVLNSLFTQEWLQGKSFGKG